MNKIVPIFKNSIPIIFATDKNFIPILYVAIQSLIDNSSDNNCYDIVILCSEIEKYKQNQFKVLEKENISVRFYEMSDLMKEYKDIWYTHWEYTEAMYYRFFIPQLFADYEKVVYLDCDVILNCDIAELYNIDLEGNYIAAAAGLARQHDDDTFRDYIENTIKIKKENYFNSGVLVFDIKKNKEINFFELCINTLKSLNEPLFPDQDVLNLIFLNKTKYIHCKYNFTWNVIHSYMNSEEKISEIFRDDFIEAKRSPKIIHYAGKFKPWKVPQLSYADYFWKYAKKTPFYEEIIYKNIPSDINRASIYNVIYRKRIYLQYLKCKLLKLITAGKMKEHYNAKSIKLKQMVRDYRITLKK